MTDGISGTGQVMDFFLFKSNRSFHFLDAG